MKVFNIGEFSFYLKELRFKVAKLKVTKIGDQKEGEKYIDAMKGNPLKKKIFKNRMGLTVLSQLKAFLWYLVVKVCRLS